MQPMCRGICYIIRRGGKKMLSKENIKVGVAVANWEEALTEAGTLLVKAGSCTEDYVKATIAAVHELGSYIVLAPHVALGHSRPSEAVKKSDISLVIPKEPVVFNHSSNDPVKLVFSFCATDNESHLEVLGKLAGILGSPESINQLAAATTVDEVMALILA